MYPMQNEQKLVILYLTFGVYVIDAHAYVEKDHDSLLFN